jgi:hypothetical protein
VRDGRRNHDYVAERLMVSDFIDVPAPLPSEERAPDSIQFNMVGLTETEVAQFAKIAGAMGIKVQVFGQSTDNARAFWNWRFLPEMPELPKTRAMLMHACDVRLPVHLEIADLDAVIAVLLDAVAKTKPIQAAAVA